VKHISAYPSVYALGHKAIEGIFDGPVLVEEKIDGSQASFGLLEGELAFRSKGKDMILDAPEQMFEKAIETIKGLPLHPDWVYRSEFLSKPKHNTLAYSRVPKQNLIIYDIQTGLEAYMPYLDMCEEAERLGLECVPMLSYGIVANMGELTSLLDMESVLGGTKVEGVVVKNYALMTAEKKVAMGKYVSERFKESNRIGWKIANPKTGDVIENIIATYKTEARWLKAVHHLRDDGLLEGSPRDIGNLMKAVPDDVQKECEDHIRDVLFAYAWPKIRRGIVAGLPQWYKDLLAESAFGGSE
jgi:hypothetical protein